MIDLKPCPFCGGEAKLHKEGVTQSYEKVYVECEDCHARSLEHTDYFTKNVIEQWNTRKQYPSSRLKVCPFCGGRARIDKQRLGREGDSYVYRATCWDCGGHTAWLADDDEVITSWNRRACDA